MENIHSLISNPTGLGMDMMAERLSHLTSIIDFNSITSIIDVGSAHGYESLNLARVFENAHVYGFEPTPEHFQHCTWLQSQVDISIASRMHFANLALNDSDGYIKFYPLDEAKAKGNNTGMASKFQLIDPNVFSHEINIQKEITVAALTLDTWCNHTNVKPDIIWMDAQGAESAILNGAKNSLSTVKVIMTEAGTTAYYKGQGLKKDIDDILLNCGFVELISARKIMHQYEMDTIYIRS